MGDSPLPVDEDGEKGARKLNATARSPTARSPQAQSAPEATKVPSVFGKKARARQPASREVKGIGEVTKWCVLAFLVFQNSGASLLMRASRAAGEWNPQTAVIAQEAIKGILCFGLVLYEGGFAALRETAKPTPEAMKTSVPALLYLFQNNMQYVAVGYLDAATYAVLYQFKILTAGMMTVLILRRPLDLLQWTALNVLTAGASIVIVSQMTSSSKQGDGRSVAVGVTAVILACLASGLAGVYFEKLLKGSTMSLWARNLQLAVYSLLIGIPGLYQSDGGRRLETGGFFDGYTPVVWASIVNNALGGLLIAIVIKHADTIMKNFSTTLSILVTTAVSVMFLGHRLEPMSIFGTALVIYAVFLYGGMSGASLVRSLAGKSSMFAILRALVRNQFSRTPS